MRTLISALVLSSVAGAASAGVAIASFTYSDLLGSYDTGTNTYTAVTGAATSGDVTRLDANPGSAEFDSGFKLGPTAADFSIVMTVGNINAGTADGVGTLVITDDNGDTITADINGLFRVFAGSVAYEGILDNVLFNNNSGDGFFNGTSSGSFSTAFPGPGPFNGSLISLFFDPGSFFGNGFSNQTTLTSGLIIPAPAAAGLIAAAGLFVARRRR